MLAHEIFDGDIVAFGPFRIDAREGTVFKNGRRLRLPRKVLEVIAYMAANRERVVTPDELVDAVWLGEPITDGNVAQHICYARKALDDAAKPHAIIKTVHGRGYMFAPRSETLQRDQEHAGLDTHELLAQELYRNGKAFLKCGSPAALESGLAFFERASRLCPLYEPAYSGMAEAHVKLARRLYRMPGAAFDAARAFARRALLLDGEAENACIVLAAVALYADYDADAAYDYLSKAARRRPDLPLLHAIRAQAYLFDRRLERAKLAVQEGLDWAPDSVMLRTQAGVVAYYAGDYDSAVSQLEQLVTLEPGATFARCVLACAALFAGNVQGARDLLKAILERDLWTPDEYDMNAAQHALAALIFLEARHGDHDVAVRLFHEFGSYVPGQYISPVCLAAALCGFGHHLETSQRLRDARSTCDPSLVFVKLDPFFGHLRAEPHFEKICDEVLSRKSILEDVHFKT